MSVVRRVLVREDGRTTCCEAFTSIFIDDGLEYCKACFESVEGLHRDSNEVARNGVDRCWCGSKYWERDRCVDCGTRVESKEI